ncbi:MAG: hypothetical protein OXG37_16540 [Actinomycetia bacterium]|nr:hypothetical protein [Actinomycetes bacterium]
MADGGPQDWEAEDNLVAGLLFAAAPDDGAERAGRFVQQAREQGL